MNVGINRLRHQKGVLPHAGWTIELGPAATANGIARQGPWGKQPRSDATWLEGAHRGALVATDTELLHHRWFGADYVEAVAHVTDQDVARGQERVRGP